MLTKLLAYGILLLGATAIFTLPWVTLACYEFVSLLQPKYIWRFTWPDIPMTKYLGILVIVGFMFAALMKRIDFRIYRNGQVYCLLLMWGLMHLSELLSPYPVYFAGTRGEIVLSAMNTIVIVYLLGIGLLSDHRNPERMFKVMGGVFIAIALYYTWWANDQYLSQNWRQFEHGRLAGPFSGPYRDGNVLSVILVMGSAFLLLLFFYARSRVVKYGALLALPLLWHALILFSSRGALLATLAATFVGFRLVKKDLFSLALKTKRVQIRAFTLLIGMGLVTVLIWQGGVMMERTKQTVQKAEAHEDEPLNPRLISWHVGLKLIKDFPLLGAGPQRFQMASEVMYPGENIHVAHNTFLNFSANTGLPVGLLYLTLFLISYKNYRFCKTHGIGNYPTLDYLNKSCAAALVGFFVGAFFLDLIIFEPFYFILMINHAKLFCFRRYLNQDPEEAGIASAQPINQRI